jgi:negative regulator of flagellin synthesis FlgM
MKIYSNKPPENQGPSGAQNVQKTQAADARDGNVNQARKTAPADKVNISDRSREIADLMAAVNQLPDVREARVQEIKESVEAGTYRVDPRKVAEKMISEIV